MTPTFKKAQKLVKKLTPITIGDYKLKASIEERNPFPDEKSWEIVFSGGRWGPHRLLLTFSSLSNIKGHWDGYVEAHKQYEARLSQLRKVPAKTTYKKEPWIPQVGHRCFFRNILRQWRNVTILKLYEGQRWFKKAKLADLLYVNLSGRYLYKRVPISYLTRRMGHYNLKEC